ncbi:MAG: hypothetical protein DYG98_08440 [Haliscomenobacteraceae bacterium CHB4]|nr:hypothetical protein [Haliscomenobacteraceae bacterium CHB4]
MLPQAILPVSHIHFLPVATHRANSAIFKTKNLSAPPRQNDTFCPEKKGVINRIMTSPRTPRRLEVNFLIWENFLNFVYSYSCIAGQNLKQNLLWWRIWIPTEK